MKKKRVRCFVDGMNLYNRVFKELNIKWVDLESLLLELIQSKIPDAEIEKIILFIARMHGEEGKRQKIYLKALQIHSPNISIVYGYFKSHPKMLPVVDENDKVTNKFEKVMVTEEKGTDVNIATELLFETIIKDKSNFEYLCLVTNDSDLERPIRVIRKFGQEMILITPNISIVNSEGKVVNLISKKLKSLVKKRFLITKFTRELVLRNLLPPKVGDLVPPKGDGWFSYK